ncbi:3-hydroxyacyl-CoA dehydrogenase family protein [Candidatus Thioglobus sp.]|nr:3-hydroxyacyl-CoA dehydrogenase family protein [Candidatus Thioglobus sp.]
MEVNVIGAGVMGHQIVAFLNGLGYKVYLYTSNNNPSTLIKKIRVSARVQGLMFNRDNLVIINNIDDLDKEILTIESSPDNLDVKKSVYMKFAEDNIDGYFTTTSSIPLNLIGNNVSGLHFFNPISIKLIEYDYQNNKPTAQQDELLKRLMLLDYNLIEIFNMPGYLANRIIFNEISEAFKLYELHNVSAKDIKSIYTDVRKSQDPFALSDLIGIDTCKLILTNLEKYVSKNYRVPQLFRDAVSLGVLGKKNSTSIVSLLDHVE